MPRPRRIPFEFPYAPTLIYVPNGLYMLSTSDTAAMLHWQEARKSVLEGQLYDPSPGDGQLKGVETKYCS